jgi:hypothetical protein
VVAQVEPAVAQLSRLGDVPSSYVHHQRLVTPGADLGLPGAYLKWYEIRRMLAPISAELVQESRDFLREQMETGRLGIENQVGFVVLHRGDGPSGPNTYLMLMVMTWRNTNELWQTVYTQDLTGGTGFQRLDVEGHAPTYCVWELAPVWHEQQARTRFLYSSRDDAAKLAYVNDRFAGLI